MYGIRTNAKLQKPSTQKLQTLNIPDENFGRAQKVECPTSHTVTETRTRENPPPRTLQGIPLNTLNRR